MRGLRTSRGYTLIEIVLVLAIAGLLLIIVFAAVSQAQKTRRDAQRKQDLAAFVAAVGSYAANNFLQTPEDDIELGNLMNQYFASRSDPLGGGLYVGDFWNRGANHDLNGGPAMGHIAFVQGHLCGVDVGASTIVGDPPNYNSTMHMFAAVIRLEQGGLFCISGGN